MFKYRFKCCLQSSHYTAKKHEYSAHMAKRTSPNAIQSADDLSRLASLVVDKRLGQRSSAKKNRRNRHYENQLIRNSLSSGVLVDKAADEGHF